jgi:hypothetical protein
MVLEKTGTRTNILRKGGSFMHRLVTLCVVVVTFLWVVSTHAADTHQGKVVETSPGTLTMTDLTGKNQHTMAIPTDATVMRDGKTGALTDLKPGDTVTVTTEKQGDKPKVTKVEAKPAGS